MKHFIAVVILFLSIRSYSQSSVKPQPYSATSLNQYLWSFSKNTSVPSKKSLIDFEVIDNWRGLGNYLAVTNDGMYFSYTINQTGRVFRMGQGLIYMDSLVVQSTKNNWRRAFALAETGFFTADGRQYIFQSNGVLCFLQLGGGDIRNIKDVDAYKMSKNEWIAYQLKDKGVLTLQNLITRKEKIFPGIMSYDFDNSGEWLIGKNDSTKELLLYNLAAGTEKHFPAVDAYLLSENGKVLLLRTSIENTTSLQLVSLEQGVTKAICSTRAKATIDKYSMDASGKQVAFIVTDSDDPTNAGIYYYREGTEKGVLKLANQTPAIPAGLTIVNVSFTSNGRYLDISMKKKPEEIRNPTIELAGLDVWNHKDLYLQSVQPALGKRPKSYRAIVNIEDGKPVLLESEDRKINLLQGDFAVVIKDGKVNCGDRFWEQGNPLNQDSSWVFSLKDGNSRLLPTKSKRFWFSPASNYLVYVDADKGYHYFSYDLHTTVLKDITTNISGDQFGFIERLRTVPRKPQIGNLAAWIENDEGVLAYDNYDIWKLDLKGEKPALNITNGFGRSKRTIFNLLTTDHYSDKVLIIKTNQSLVLRGYSVDNKQSGFYKKISVDVGYPTKLYMGDYFITKITGCHDDNLSNDGMAPLKAKNVNSWIVQRQSANDASNFYETTDFKNFRRLTNFQPQKNFQWLTEELVTYKRLDGTLGQGILYKPENFDPSRKYPVLIPFYVGAFSDNLFQFPNPSFTDEGTAPGKWPLWFLNNGYLVFAPDMLIAPFKVGPSAFNVIEGAAQYLKALPYVDGNKLAIGTHSQSAKLGAYMMTHSTSFSAVVSSEGFGFADLTTISLGPNEDDGRSVLGGVENNLGYGSIWENKEAWIDNITVLNADKSKTPLLVFCNKESSENYQLQTFELFNALRRLDKNVWWLKYDNGNHTLGDPKELKDFTVRYTQFLDHYLKDAPAPVWMTQGIPYQLRGIESGYELDPKGSCAVERGEFGIGNSELGIGNREYGGNKELGIGNKEYGEKRCVICEAWNLQCKRHPEMLKKPIVEWELDKDIAEELERKQNERRKELDREGEVMNKKILDILKNGYAEDEKRKAEKINK